MLCEEEIVLGLREIEEKIRVKAAYKKKSVELMLEELGTLLESMKELKKRVKAFEKKWGKDIKEDREFYEKMAEIREELGLPEEVGVFKWKEKPGSLEKLTGKGSFYDQLGIEILEMTKELKEENGGLMALSEVVLETNKRRPGMVIAPGYIVKAVEKLENEKLIPGIKKLKSGAEIVEFFSVSMTTDGMEILSVAAKKGWTTLEEVILKTEWNRERAKRALEGLKDAGIARIDKSYSEGEKYYFPGLGGH